MSRDDRQRLLDVLAAARAIEGHLERGAVTDGLVFDAVRVRLIEIGEAVKGLGSDVRAAAPDVPWSDVAGMRDVLTHRYFDASHSIVEHTVRRDVPDLVTAVRRVLRDLPATDSVRHGGPARGTQ